MPTSRGLDVSSYQGAQDWPTLAKSGITFAFAKASEGEHTTDGHFAMHIKGIAAAGLVPGAYHFAWPNQSAAAEAAHYVSVVKPYAKRGFVHVLDLERRSDGANYKGRTAAQIRAYAQAWIAAVSKAFPGQRVGVYTSANDIAAKHVPANSGFLWYPAYPSGAMSYAQAEARARPAPSGQRPLFWQFTSTPLDRNLAYLSPADLRAWAAGDTEHHDQEDDMPITQADAKLIAKEVASYSHGDKPDVHQTWATAAAQATAANATLKGLTAQVAALTATVSAMAKGGGLSAAEITAAAEAGARAALAELGDALTPED